MIARIIRRVFHIDGQGSHQIPHPPAGHRQGSIILNPLQFTLGSILLAVGLGFYYHYRITPIALFDYVGIQPASVPMAPAMAHYLENSLPSLSHILSLSLLLGSLIRPGYLRYMWVCLFWLLVDVLFEAAQAYGSAVLTVLPERMSAAPLFGAIHDYLRYGSYDSSDMTAIIFGACLAYGMLVLTGMRGLLRRQD